MEVCAGCWKGIGDVEYVAPAAADKASVWFNDDDWK